MTVVSQMYERQDAPVRRKGARGNVLAIARSVFPSHWVWWHLPGLLVCISRADNGERVFMLICYLYVFLGEMAVHLF